SEVHHRAEHPERAVVPVSHDRPHRGLIPAGCTGPSRPQRRARPFAAPGVVILLTAPISPPHRNALSFAETPSNSAPFRSIPHTTAVSIAHSGEGHGAFGALCQIVAVYPLNHLDNP